MPATALDYDAIFRADLPPPAQRWAGFAPYNFIGGHNDPEGVPVPDLIQAARVALEREGRNLATYNLETGPLGYRPLREFVAAKLLERSGMRCSPDDILITSGSLQGLDLVNEAMLGPGDTVIVEQFSYGGALSRIRKRGATPVGIPVDDEGIRTDLLAARLAELGRDGVTPKYIYVIPTVQNPTGGILGEARRRELLDLSAEYGIPIFEDECYADLLWDGERPAAIAGLDSEAGGNRVIHVGSFSKTIAPALRVGYLVADWEILRRIMPCKTDAGSGALEQIVLAEYCARHFDRHIEDLTPRLRAKLDAMVEAVEANFGTAAEFTAPKGGIFLWIKLPEQVDTARLFTAAQAEGVAINPGPEWSSDAAPARSCLRLCFANPSVETIRAGVAKLAEICHREFGVPTRIANVQSG